MMKGGAAVRGLLEFFVGEDWRTAVGVLAALGVTALLASAGVAAWWVMPLAVAALLAASLGRGVRSGAPHRPQAATPPSGDDDAHAVERRTT